MCLLSMPKKRSAHRQYYININILLRCALTRGENTMTEKHMDLFFAFLEYHLLLRTTSLAPRSP